MYNTTGLFDLLTGVHVEPHVAVKDYTGDNPFFQGVVLNTEAETEGQKMFPGDNDPFFDSNSTLKTSVADEELTVLLPPVQDERILTDQEIHIQYLERELARVQAQKGCPTKNSLNSSLAPLRIGTPCA
eukprot:TRINITY_DN6240_c0_g1_i2.p1 TRINITY_DN6240_c0_g1~~TRINITY_DN6240_c0_g1_i2.p1  ORF type:complete len:129 (+),score=27.58 TRINITY_DN6240_c0_g1_i2:395-781(+)